MPRSRPRRRVLALGCVATAAAAAAAGCGLGSGGGGGAPSGPSPASALSGHHLTVLAAASLSGAFSTGEKALERSAPGFSAAISFAGSQQLVSQVEAGAPADVVATADMASMERLVAAGLVEAPVPFARNRLEIVVATGNPKGVRGLADLARPDLITVLCDPAVPAGRYGRQALERAHVTVAPRSLELDVEAALDKVRGGEADAAIVYATDVTAAGGAVTGVAIPDAQNVVASYPIAVVRSTSDRAAAEAFVEEVVGGRIAAVLRARGFLAAA